jgi:hypothetical protein
MDEKIKQIPSSPESVIDKIDRLLEDAQNRMDIVEFNEKLVTFAQKIKKNHPDYQRYRCYHKLIGSTPFEDDPNVIEEDFEGEDSVAAFLEGLLKEAGKETLNQS